MCACVRACFFCSRQSSLYSSQVGAISIDQEDDKGQTFTIQVLGRLYLLRANTKASCRDWVISLNRIKEARLNQGNVKLVNPSSFSQPVDLLDRQESDVQMMRPRVVVVANRERTRAVAESEDFENMISIRHDDPGVVVVEDVAQQQQQADQKYKSERRRSTIGTVVLARWTKRRSSMSRLSAKLAKWARSLRKYSCTEIEQESVYLDRHVHPPGHDDKVKQVRPSPTGKSENSSGGSSTDDGLSGWIGKEASRTARPSPEEENSASGKPNTLDRQVSVASEDGARFLS